MISRRKRKQVRNPDWQEKKSTRVKVQRVVSDGMRVNPLAHNHNHNRKQIYLSSALFFF